MPPAPSSSPIIISSDSSISSPPPAAVNVVEDSAFSLGTGFLHLPYELRKMIYDLHFSKPRNVIYLGDAPPIIGVSLLRVCKQIYEDNPQHHIRSKTFMVSFPQDKQPTDGPAIMDLSLAMSCLHRSALAKIQDLSLSITVTNDYHAIWTRFDLSVLVHMIGLEILRMRIILGTYEDHVVYASTTDFTDMPYIAGIVIKCLSQIPCRIPYAFWRLNYWNEQQSWPVSSDAMARLAREHKILRGTAYIDKQTTQDISYMF
jgi:hypothetical protein